MTESNYRLDMVRNTEGNLKDPLLRVSSNTSKFKSDQLAGINLKYVGKLKGLRKISIREYL